MTKSSKLLFRRDERGVMNDENKEFIRTLIHEERKRKYDPVKRREYYLRTRELKGRKPGKPSNPSKAQETFRSSERKFGKADLDRASKVIEKRVTQMLGKMLDQKKALDKLEEAGQRGTPEYQNLLAQYVKTLRTLSLNDPDANWTDSRRVPEYSDAQKLRKLLDSMPDE